jgi:hypothetical protein
MKDGLPDNPCAFPVPNDSQVNGDVGMTLRDYFAAHIMAGYMTLEDGRTCPKERLPDIDGWRKEIALQDAKHVWMRADALLLMREK